MKRLLMSVLLTAVLVVTSLMVAKNIKADTVNPQSNVMADSNATAQTLVYRDSNGLSGLGQLNITRSQVGSNTTLAGGVYTSTIIPVTSTFINLLSTSTDARNFIMNSVPTITTTTLVGGTVGIADGTYIILTTTMTGANFVLQDNSVLSGSQLLINASSVTITNRQSASFIFNALDSKWHFVP